ncbi:flavin reductase family protein [Croceicoccus marinus]|uniref:Monooxygenase n=1 Tax=Croceicoccus marinus TaxID=450378 RepID=A0A1Z1FCS2_9SPHN|nr:flavin reductase family protein [Croceicoccus marinus]ARU16560.1 monooxygenase [Croceicoccus marinus]
MAQHPDNIDVEIDPAHFRSVLGNYPTGVCVVTAFDQQAGAVGMVVGSFGSVSLEPPLVAFYIGAGSSSWAQIRECGHFCVNVLGEDQLELCKRIASRKEDKFHDVAHRQSDNGMPVLDGVVATIECTIESETDAGDHVIVLGRVMNLTSERDGGPLLFFRGGYGRFEQLD